MMKPSLLSILSGLLLFVFLLSSCQQPATRTFENEAFSVEYPGSWQEMSELWPNYQLKDDYYRLGIHEIVTLTSVRKQGEIGAFFTVASSGIPEGLDLKTLFQQTYDPLSDEIVDVTEGTQTVDGKTGLVIQYRRPWGEPWWEFQDIWVEVDGTAYVLSSHAFKLESYQEAIDQILAGFTLK
jgi:hypothetical protein